ncbi:hypothetical protein C8Q78DRAFT_301898 [Trametes maxima]|nr:hypothetical protein C8Q78DRAFT_301898 [Trametes maxima]
MGAHRWHEWRHHRQCQADAVGLSSNIILSPAIVTDIRCALLAFNAGAFRRCGRTAGRKQSSGSITPEVDLFPSARRAMTGPLGPRDLESSHRAATKDGQTTMWPSSTSTQRATAPLCSAPQPPCFSFRERRREAQCSLSCDMMASVVSGAMRCRVKDTTGMHAMCTGRRHLTAKRALIVLASLSGPAGLAVTRVCDMHMLPVEPECRWSYSVYLSVPHKAT